MEFATFKAANNVYGRFLILLIIASVHLGFEVMTVKSTTAFWDPVVPEEPTTSFFSVEV
jgi:hypothetical protein